MHENAHVSVIFKRAHGMAMGGKVLLQNCPVQPLVIPTAKLVTQAIEHVHLMCEREDAQ